MDDNGNNKPQGLKIDKKTIIPITALLFGIMVFVGILTQVVPRGEYRLDANGSIIDGTYTLIEGGKLPFWRVFTAPVEVFGSSEALFGIAIILFIVLIGGTFMILDRSRVLKYIMSSIVKRYAAKKYKLLAIIVFVCMALASTIGILEESITLVPLAVAISLALGWDSFVGLGISLISIAFGFTATTFNPFNVGVVQGLAGIPMFSGLWFRVLVFAAVYLSLTGYLILYAKKIEKNPQKSLAYKNDLDLRERFGTALKDEEAVLANPSLKKATATFVGCVLSVFAVSFVSLFLTKAGVVPESLQMIVSNLPLASMAILFTAGGIAAGKTAGMSEKTLLRTFGEGAKAIAPCAPMIIFVMSITYLLKQGKIIHTILYHTYNLIDDLSPATSLLLIFLFIILLEFFIGSSTAKAFLIIPIVIQLAVLLGITKQTVVIAYSLSDGFCNLLYPTSGIMIIAIGIVNISYGKFLRWSWKLFAVELIVSVSMLMLALAIGY